MSDIASVTITPGRKGYEIAVDPGVQHDIESYYVSDMFDLHRTLDRLFPPQKPEAPAEKVEPEGDGK